MQEELITLTKQFQDQHLNGLIPKDELDAAADEFKEIVDSLDDDNLKDLVEKARENVRTAFVKQTDDGIVIMQKRCAGICDIKKNAE